MIQNISTDNMFVSEANLIISATRRKKKNKIKDGPENLLPTGLGAMNLTPEPGVTLFMHRVMQSDGNSFCGDVVSYSFSKTSRDEDNILYQIYIKANIFVLLL